MSHMEKTSTGNFNTSSDHVVDIPTTLHAGTRVLTVRDAHQLQDLV